MLSCQYSSKYFGQFEIDALILIKFYLIVHLTLSRANDQIIFALILQNDHVMIDQVSFGVTVAPSEKNHALGDFVCWHQNSDSQLCQLSDMQCFESFVD